MVSEWRSGRPETVCGHGSKLSETEEIRAWIPKLIKKYGIESVADVGCGDRNWTRHIQAFRDIEYAGYDVVPRDESIVKFDCRYETLPKPYDLVMCIYVLNHFYAAGEMGSALSTIIRSGSRWLLCTYNDVEEFPLEPTERLFHKYKQSGAVLRNWYYGFFDLEMLNVR